MVDSTKVLCSENLFLRELQRYKGCMTHYVDRTSVQPTPAITIIIDKNTIIPMM